MQRKSTAARAAPLAPRAQNDATTSGTESYIVGYPVLSRDECEAIVARFEADPRKRPSRRRVTGWAVS